MISKDYKDRIAILSEALEALDRLGIPRESAAASPALQFLLGQTNQTSQSPAVELEVENGSRVEGNYGARAASHLGVQEHELQDIAEFRDTGVELTIWRGRLPRKKSDRQRTLALTKLLLDKLAYEIDEVPAADINEICSRHDCFDQNLPTNLQRRGLVVRKGARGSHTYRLTLLGERQGREILVQLIKGETGTARLN